MAELWINKPRLVWRFRLTRLLLCLPKTYDGIKVEWKGGSRFIVIKGGVKLRFSGEDSIDEAIDFILTPIEEYTPPAPKGKRGKKRKPLVKTSQYVGVSRRHNGRWRAAITAFGVSTHIGIFESEIEAAHAYDDFVKQRGLNKPLNFAS